MTKVERIYYALSDSFSGDDPKEHTAGFANKKEPIGFRSWEARTEWLKNTKLTTARAITRAEAIKFASYDAYVQEAGQHIKAARIYNEPTKFSILKTIDA